MDDELIDFKTSMHGAGKRAAEFRDAIIEKALAAPPQGMQYRGAQTGRVTVKVQQTNIPRSHNMHQHLTQEAFNYLMDVMSNESTDFRELVGEIAKSAPGLVVEAARAIGGDHDPALSPAVNIVRGYVRAGKGGDKIKMIKDLRNETGMGLAEAKQAIEETIKVMGVP